MGNSATSASSRVQGDSLPPFLTGDGKGSREQNEHPPLMSRHTLSSMSFHDHHSSSQHSLPGSSGRHRQRGINRSMSERERRTQPKNESPVQSTSVDIMSKDSVEAHIVHKHPPVNERSVELGSTVIVQFDKSLKVVKDEDLITLTCTDGTTPVVVKGRVIHNATTNRSEFIPLRPLKPQQCYEVKVTGRAVTTDTCTFSSNISSYRWKFQTGSPVVKTINVKIKGEDEMIKFTMNEHVYQDVYNSLVDWAARKIGISGEFLKDMCTVDSNGFQVVISNDRDLLNVQDNQVVIVDVKD